MQHQRPLFQRIDPESISGSTQSIRLRHPLAVSNSAQECLQSKKQNTNHYQNHDYITGGQLEPRTLATEEYSAASSAQIMQMLEASGRNNSKPSMTNESNTLEQVNLMRQLANDHNFTQLVEEQKLMQQAEQLQQQVPLTHVSIGTNDESSGIFDYYRRSVSECGGAQGSTSQQNHKSSIQQPNNTQIQPYQASRNAMIGHNTKDSSFISVPFYNTSLQNDAHHQNQSTLPAFEKNSLCDNSQPHMFESTLLAERNAAIESLSHTQPTEEGTPRPGQSRLSNNYNVMHSVSLNCQPDHVQNNNGQGAALFHNAYTNLNLNSQQQQQSQQVNHSQNTSLTADQPNRRRNNQKREQQRILSSDIQSNQMKTRQHGQRQKQRAKSSVRAQANTTALTGNNTNMLMTGNQPFNQNQHPQNQLQQTSRILNHTQHPSMAQVMPPQDFSMTYTQQIELQQQMRNQQQSAAANQSQHLNQELAQNQLTFSSATHDPYQGRPPIISKPLSMSLLNSSGGPQAIQNQSSHFYGHNPLASSIQLDNNQHSGKPPIGMLLEQSKTTRACSDYPQNATMSLQNQNNNSNHHVASSSFGTQDGFQFSNQQASQQQQQQLLQMAQMTGETARQPQHSSIPYDNYHQSGKIVVEAPSGLGARHRSLDATASRHQPYNRITTNTIDSSSNMQAPNLDYFDQVQPMSTFSGKDHHIRENSNRNTIHNNNTQSYRNCFSAHTQQDSLALQHQPTHNHTIQSNITGPQNTKISTSPQTHLLSLLQQEKGQLADQVFLLNEHVGQLEHQKLKLRKSKKKLRIQLDQTKIQLNESKRKSSVSQQSNDKETLVTNNLLAMAINDLRTKVLDIKETSTTQNEMHLKTLQNTMDVLYKNLMMSNTNSERETRMSQHNGFTGDNLHHKTEDINGSQAMTRPVTERGLGPQKHLLKTKEVLEGCIPASRENLTTEIEKTEKSTSRSHMIQEAQQEYQAVMQQSPGLENEGNDYETGMQLNKTTLSSEQSKPDYTNELNSIKEENKQLKAQLAQQAKLLEEQTRTKDSETVDILQKYQSAVQKMHGRLKEVALKFDEGEKNRQARLRKARKSMEIELVRLTEMNEQLFQSCQQFQEKFLEQTLVNQQQQASHNELFEERERQGDHISQLININKGQVALIENIKKRLSQTEAVKVSMRSRKDLQAYNSARMRRSRSSSVQIHSLRINQAFESETKINDLLSSQEDIYQMTMQHKVKDDIHERSEERQSDQQVIKKESMTDVNISRSAIQMKRETTERYTIEALLEEGRTLESQQMRRSLLEPNLRSSTNHESHHDQHDYDSTLRAEIVNQIPQLSPFLMTQLTKRLELENKIADHKNYLKQHNNQQNLNGRSIDIQAANNIPIQNELVVTSPSMISPKHAQQIIFPNNVFQLDQEEQKQIMDVNQHMDMKYTPSTQKASSTMIQAQPSSSQQLQTSQQQKDHKGGISVYSSTLHQIQQYQTSSNQQVEGIYQVQTTGNELNSGVATGGMTNKDQTRSVEGDSKQLQQAMSHHNSVSFHANNFNSQQTAGIHILQEALFQKTCTTTESLQQEPMMGFGAINDQKDPCSKQDEILATKQARTTDGQHHTQGHQRRIQNEFWNLKQLVSLDSSILTEAHSSLNASLMKEKHVKMSQDYEQLEGSQEILLTKIKDEIGNLDQEIIVLQRNLTHAINKRH